ncbi:hypothetical protein AAIA72_14035 [Hahella sp. SMD15-11]|uniref:SPOR domain-containing protein n=1 Tax=Thermohahella caldifontis TaxID=3142973 RepID=A0AB39UUF2_9GAMM
MRWIFLSLLLLNGLVFLVQYKGWAGSAPVPQQAVVNEKAQPLILLKELRATDPYKSVLVADSSHRTSKKSREQLCMLFGPLYDEDAADELLSYLVKNRIEARKIVKEREIAPDYWVYIPPCHHALRQTESWRSCVSGR